MATIPGFASFTVADFDAELRALQQILDNRTRQVENAQDRAVQMLAQNNALAAQAFSQMREADQRIKELGLRHKHEADLQKIQEDAASKRFSESQALIREGHSIQAANAGLVPVGPPGERTFQFGPEEQRRRKLEIENLEREPIFQQLQQDALLNSIEKGNLELKNMRIEQSAPSISEALDRAMAKVPHVFTPDERERRAAAIAGIDNETFAAVKEFRLGRRAAEASVKSTEAEAARRSAIADRTRGAGSATAEGFADAVIDDLSINSPDIFQGPEDSPERLQDMERIRSLAKSAFSNDVEGRLDPTSYATDLVSRRRQSRGFSEEERESTSQKAAALVTPQREGEPAPIKSQIESQLDILGVEDIDSAVRSGKFDEIDRAIESTLSDVSPSDRKAFMEAIAALFKGPIQSEIKSQNGKVTKSGDKFVVEFPDVGRQRSMFDIPTGDVELEEIIATGIRSRNALRARQMTAMVNKLGIDLSVFIKGK